MRERGREREKKRRKKKRDKNTHTEKGNPLISTFLFFFLLLFFTLYRVSCKDIFLIHLSRIFIFVSSGTDQNASSLGFYQNKDSNTFDEYFWFLKMRQKERKRRKFFIGRYLVIFAKPYSHGRRRHIGPDKRKIK